MISIGKMLKKALSGFSRFRCYFSQPNSSLNRLYLTEKRANTIEFVMPPVLKQASGFWSDFPVCRIWQVSPQVYLDTQAGDNRCLIILLVF